MMKPMPLKYARLTPDAIPPQRKHPTDAGVDVFASETVTIPPFKAQKVHTGLSFEVREDFMLLVKPKSGSDFLIGAGVVDPGYQGEILVKVVNYTPEPLTIARGQPLAQLVQVRIYTDPLEDAGQVEDLHAVRSARGADGGIVRQ